MSNYDKQNVLRSLDSLLYYHFAYTYFLDASLALLLFRIFVQLPLLTSRTLPYTLRTAVGVITAELGICLLSHASSEPGQPGVLIDFVGNQSHVSVLRLIALDLIIYVFQMIRIFMTFHVSLGSHVVTTTVSVPPALVPALGTESLTFLLPTSSPPNTDSNQHHLSSNGSNDLFYPSEDLVMDIDLRSSFRSIIHTPPQEDAIDRLPV